MSARLLRKKVRGQSLPLIALMIVVLMALVGLSVDVGNTYAEQRNTQRATNAAALAGMNALIAGGSDYTVQQAIVNSLKSNGIDAAEDIDALPGQRILRANYLDESGNALSGCANVGNNCPQSVLQKARYIRVDVSGRVDTYFARVVGQQDLPVAADAWAARGACTTIYPLGVRSNALTTTGFVSSEGNFSGGEYRNRTTKTLTLQTTANPNGNFVWLRWSANANSSTHGSGSNALVTMMKGTGNIAEEFAEAPWPTNHSEYRNKPEGYPIVPGQLTVGDWVYAGATSTPSGLGTVLAEHKFAANKDVRVLILPIVDATDGNNSYRVASLGAFAVTDYNVANNKVKLAYLGDAPECSTLREPPATPGVITLVGQVRYTPRHFEIPDNAQPVQYVIILDVSGSMSWNYKGQAHSGSTIKNCTGTNACSGIYWKTESERRIYIAKQAINAFVDQMRPKDTIRLISYSGNRTSGYSETNAINSLTAAYPSNGWGTAKTEAEKAGLKSTFKSAGRYNNNDYLTSGGTPSATALQAAIRQFQSAPTKSPEGQEFRRVAIFLTDGVANVQPDGSLPTYPRTGGCNDMGSEKAECNTPVNMPIWHAIQRGLTLRDYAQVYVIAMAGVATNGLQDIAGSDRAPFFTESTDPDSLQAIFKSIATNVQMGDCVPAGGTDRAGTISQSQFKPISPYTGPYPHVGKAYLSDENGGNTRVANVSVNSATGVMEYVFENVEPGKYYQLQAGVAAVGEDDVNRKYELMYNINTARLQPYMTIFVPPLEALNQTVVADTAYLDMIGSVCP